MRLTPYATAHAEVLQEHRDRLRRWVDQYGDKIAAKYLAGRQPQP